MHLYIKKTLLIIVACVLIVGVTLYILSMNGNQTVILPIRDSKDMIEVNLPYSGQAISSPLHVAGKARGGWYFEASFPVVLVDWDGRIIAQGPATAKGDWMTAQYVPFEATLQFVKPADAGPQSKRGTLIFKKDNPSGLPQNDAAIEVPIIFN